MATSGKRSGMHALIWAHTTNEDLFMNKKFFLLNLKKNKKRTQKQAHQHDTFKLKLHWQLQANDQACTPSFEHFDFSTVVFQCSNVSIIFFLQVENVALHLCRRRLCYATSLGDNAVPPEWFPVAFCRYGWAAVPFTSTWPSASTSAGACFCQELWQPHGLAAESSDCCRLREPS